jgi:large subunit ribosomal protein L17
MRHRKKGRKLGRTAAHRKAMVRNLVCNLFLAEPKEDGPRRVTTTVPKAKEARRVAERAITLGKKATLHARRRALTLLGSKRVVKTLFENIAPLYNDRNGGYTRIVRLARSRLGDGADLCYFELVSEALEAAAKAPEPVAPRVAEAPEPEEAAAKESEGQETEGGEAPEETAEEQAQGEPEEQGDDSEEPKEQPR